MLRIPSRTVLLFFTAVLIAVPANAQPEAQDRPAPHWDSEHFISLDELEPGMTGRAFTQVRGNRIDSFEVEVISVIEGRGFHNRDYLLGHSSGPLLDLTNGIAGGMSGSPVYIDGRLAGAVSGHWSFTSQRATIITPIEHMLAAFNDDPRFPEFQLAPPDHSLEVSGLEWSEPAEISDRIVNNSLAGPQEGLPQWGSLNPPVELDGRKIERVVLPQNSGEAKLARGLADSRTAVAEPAASPWIVNGISPELTDEFERAMRSFVPERMMQSWNLPPRPEAIESSDSESPDWVSPEGLSEDAEIDTGTLTGGSESSDSATLHPGFVGSLPPNATPPANLQPGSTITIPYMRGDIQSYSYGTFTYLDGSGNFLAYGHPHDRAGTVSLPAGSGYVYNVPPNIRRVGKLALQGEVVGSVFQDRGAAIAGTLGQRPGYIPLKVRVSDESTGEFRNFDTQVAKARYATPGLLFSAVQSAIPETLRRADEGTVRLYYDITFDGLPGTYSRSNLYYTDNLPGRAGFHAGLLTEFAIENERQQVFPEQIVVSAEVYPERRSARIGEVELIDRENYEKLTIRDGWRVGQLPEDLETLNEQDGFTEMSPRGKHYALVKLVPYRQDPVWAVQRLVVPEAFETGRFVLEVFGGSEDVPAGIEVGPSERGDHVRALRRRLEPYEEEPPESLEQELRIINRLPTNDELVFRFTWGEELPEIDRPVDAVRPHYRRGRETGMYIEGAERLWVHLKPPPPSL